jgi:hypothetical protein
MLVVFMCILGEMNLEDIVSKMWVGDCLALLLIIGSVRTLGDLLGDYKDSSGLSSDSVELMKVESLELLSFR